ncbi:alpha/beta fold hydrolase [Geodermatophilus sp. DSM 44513]|uniref:alpha/beta fold hydrolase n=1 Tax=Geodermatophilus sp. DSM 44513 TaxID=1528104 RepID=UPI0014137001|nr:alpha/beta hydrolase [Geodermatophilus sp. DSM 44513]WNV73613.1 alpha/beta hydrolase [Geodermatophilus sp. DSM 44513]
MTGDGVDADGAAAHPVSPAAGSWPPVYSRVRVGAASVRVGVAGEGPPLLLLNGIGANIEMWEPAVRRLPGRQVVMLDVPGTGGSPALRSGLRMSGYGRLVTGVLDALGHVRVDVLGYSWGGALAQQVAHQAPSRVRNLVLAATTPGLGGQPPAPWVLALMASPTRYYSRRYLRLTAPLLFGSDPRVAADSAHGQARLRRPPSLLGYTQQLYAISGWSSRWWLDRVQHPTLVIGARRDPLAPPRNARIMAAALPHAQLRMVDGGHLFLFEDPDAGCALVETFLRRQEDELAGDGRGPRRREGVRRGP